MSIFLTLQTDILESSISVIENNAFPIWVKIAYTIFVAILVPVYIMKWGPANFLWFSDLALLFTLVALWMENALLISIIATGVLLPEIAWNIDYFWRLITGRRLLGLSDYMFETEKSLFVRGLSLFHVILPVIMIWMLAELGYASQAIYYTIFLGWFVLISTYFTTDPKENINWVFGPGNQPQEKIHPLVYLGVVLILIPLVVFVPTYFLLKIFF
jgi:hypothetical protein